MFLDIWSQSPVTGHLHLNDDGGHRFYRSSLSQSPVTGHLHLNSSEHCLLSNDAFNVSIPCDGSSPFEYYCYFIFKLIDSKSQSPVTGHLHLNSRPCNSKFSFYLQYGFGGPPRDSWVLYVGITPDAILYH